MSERLSATNRRVFLAWEEGIIAGEFPSLKAKQVLAVLMRGPLGYEVVRQNGSHRKLESPNGYPPIGFSAHDGATVAPRAVKDLFVSKVGLSEDEALSLL